MIGQQHSVADPPPLAQPFRRQAGHPFRHLSQDEGAAHRAAVHDAAGGTGGKQAQQQAAAQRGRGGAQGAQPLKVFVHRQVVAVAGQTSIDLDQC